MIVNQTNKVKELEETMNKLIKIVTSLQPAATV